LQVPRLEKQIGIEVYATSSAGIDGIIRSRAEDFVVEEVLVDGSKAHTNASESPLEGHVLGCSAIKTRYLLCVMVKRNWDTLIAIKNVAKHLGISSDQIQVAGIKDANAVTAQHITIEDASPEKLQKTQFKDIEIRPLGYLRNKLSAYYLLGNSFRIRIKAIDHSKTFVRKRIIKTADELEALGGIPNFYGHQRFGTIRPITHLVGEAMIRKDFKKAAMLFLAKPSPHEHPSSQVARRELQTTHDFEKALKDFPKQLRYERIMLRHLVKNPEDFVGCFRTLPFKLLEIFVQAYESYLFNRFLSRRIALRLPLNAVEVGDYVIAVERSGLALPSVYRTVNLENRKEINDSTRAGKTRLAIPLIGFKQHTSKGVQGEIERQILENEDVSPEQFRMYSLPEISARGGLRTAVTPLNSFSVGDILSDASWPGRQEVELSFMLYRGSYATIVLREIMKPRDLVTRGF
jgi:tRNA pseudouridine13 synthase